MRWQRTRNRQCVRGIRDSGRRRRLLRRNDRPEELTNMTESLVEEDEPKVLTTTTEASIEEAKDTTRLSERLWRRRHQCVYRLRILTTTMAQRQQRNCWKRTRNIRHVRRIGDNNGDGRAYEFTTTMGASANKDEHEDYNNNNSCLCFFVLGWSWRWRAP